MNVIRTALSALGRVARRSGTYIEGKWHRVAIGGDTGETVVTQDSVLALTAAYACINTISTDLAALPLNVYRRLPTGGRDLLRDDPRHDLLHIEPNEETTAFRWRQDAMGPAGVLGWGNRIAEIERTKRTRTPAALHLIDYGRVTISRDRAGRLVYDVDGGTPLYAPDVLHFAGMGKDGVMGLTPIRVARQAFALGLDLQTFGGNVFTNASLPAGFLETDKQLDEEAVKRLRADFEALHRGARNAHRVAILEDGLTYKQTAINPEDAQWLVARRFQLLEVCRMFRVPPHKVMDLQDAHYNNIEQSNLDYVITGLVPWAVMWEQELTRKLFTREERRAGYYCEFNFNALLRGDLAARAAFYKALVEIGVFSPNDVCDLENLNPIDPAMGGDKHLVPANFTTLDQVGKPDTKLKQQRDALLGLLRRSLVDAA